MSINNVYTNKGKYIVYKSKYCMYSNDTFIKSGGTLMENSNVKENLEVLFEKFKNMIKVETVVGEAVQIGDTTLVPFVDVTFGFGTGTNHNTANKNHECGGGGGGAKMEPSAILVIKGERIELFNIKGNPYSSSFDRLIGLVPDLVSKLKSDKYIYLNDEQ